MASSKPRDAAVRKKTTIGALQCSMQETIKF